MTIFNTEYVPETKEVQLILEQVANHATRSEKTAWHRKYKNMQAYVNSINEIENSILDLMEQKQQIVDKMETIRLTMIDECIHPVELLMFKENHIDCKFCNKQLSIPNVNK